MIVFALFNTVPTLILKNEYHSWSCPVKLKNTNRIFEDKIFCNLGLEYVDDLSNVDVCLMTHFKLQLLRSLSKILYYI